MDNDIDQKIELVDKNIGDLARNLAGNNKDLEEKLKTEIREIILQSDLKSSSEETATLIKTLTGENTEADTETIVKAKEAGLGLSRWTEENIEAVRVYRGEDLKTELVEETKNNNPNITEEQIKSVRRLADNINRVYNSNGGVENQKDVVLEEYKNESIGKLKNEWNDLRGINGVLKQSPKELENLSEEHQQITNNLQGVGIPYQKFDKVASYDRVMNSIKNPEMRRFLESSRSRFKTLDRISNGKFSQVANNFVNRIGGDRIRNVANNFFNKSVVQVSNGFASKIGNQTVNSFVQNSMGNLIKNGVGGGMKIASKKVVGDGLKIATKAGVNAVKKIGIKAAVGGAKLAVGATTGPVGWLVSAALVVKDFFGNIIQKYNIGITNNKLIDMVIIGTIGLLFFYQNSLALITSSVVPPVESPGDGGGGGGGSFVHGEITTLEDGRIKSCGVGMGADFLRKTHKTWVTPGVLVGGGYNKQLEETIGDQFGKRCGVVYAAQYLASDFEYWVPYYWAGKYYSKGLNPNWGGETKPDLKGRHLTGLDCSGFVGWAEINGSGGRGGSSGAISFGNCEAIKAAIQPGDTITMPSGEPYHVALVLEYDNDKIKFAHSGGGSGVTTGWIDICSGKGLDQGMQFGYLHKKTY